MISSLNITAIRFFLNKQTPSQHDVTAKGMNCFTEEQFPAIEICEFFYISLK